MLRADNIICGTTTTGTGTLTLAASPGPPGGIDFYKFLTATGVGFANGADILVTYTIIEYTSSAFSTMKSHEKGIGTLHLGTAIGGGTPSTLARTTVQTTATSLDSQPATQNIGGAGFSIATAANVLVFIGTSPHEALSIDPYYYTGGTDRGCPPLGAGYADTAAGVFVTGTEVFYPFVWGMTMLVKTLLVHVQAAYTGGTSNLYGRIYAVGSDGRAGKLLIDFGVLGTSNSSLASAAIINSAAHANGFFLTPCSYYLSIAPIFSGGSGSPALYGLPNSGAYGGFVSGHLGADGATVHFGLTPFFAAQATSANATAPDTGNTTGWTRSGTYTMIGFSLRPS